MREPTGPQEQPQPRTSLIVPAYNEEKGLAITLERVLEHLDDSYEVIVVDDGSSDATAEVAARFPCRLIRHRVNRGKGAALRTGLRHARGDKVIWIDADDTYPAEMLPRVAAALDEYDVVVGARRHGNHNIPRFNRLGNWLFSTLIRGIYGFGATDPCTGLYGVRRAHLQAMGLSSRGFAIEPEIAIKAGRMKLSTLEIPITYRPRVGETKLNAFKVGLEDMRTILGLLFWYRKGRRARMEEEGNVYETA